MLPALRLDTLFARSFVFVAILLLLLLLFVVQRLCEEGGHKGDLKGAWITIAECLPDRTIQVPCVSAQNHLY